MGRRDRPTPGSPRRRVDRVVRLAVVVLTAMTLAGRLGIAHGAEDPTVTTEAVPGSTIRVVRASADIDASATAILAVIDDVASYTTTFPYVAESRVVTRTASSVVVYQRLRFPVPLLSDRDYVIRLTAPVASAAPGGAVHRRAWQIDPSADVPAVQGVVRVTLDEGAWTVTATAPGRTRVDYCVFTDPGGGVWAWLANQANVQAIPRLFQSLREAVTRPRYAHPADADLLQPDPAVRDDLRVCGGS